MKNRDSVKFESFNCMRVKNVVLGLFQNFPGFPSVFLRFSGVSKNFPGIFRVFTRILRILPKIFQDFSWKNFLVFPRISSFLRFSGVSKNFSRIFKTISGFSSNFEFSQIF